MNRGKSSHIPEFKGIYYNESKEQNIFEGGAHFKYKDLYLLLEKLKQSYPYNINENPSTSTLSTTNKNGYTYNIDKNESKTRNNQIKIEKSNTKQQLISYTNKVNRNIFHYIQAKYIGVALYGNNTQLKNKVKNKVIIPKPNNNNKVSLNQPQSKPIYVQRNQSEDPPQNNQKTHPTSSRITSSTQKVIEYSDRVKQKNMNSSRANGTRNYKNNTNGNNINGSTSINKHINNTSNNNNNSNHVNNGNQHTFAFSNRNSQQVKSRNCHRITANDFFGNHSFYTKSDYRRKEKKEIISVRHTMDKEVMLNKTLNTRKVCSSITISTRGKNVYSDKCCNKAGIKPKRDTQNINGSIDMQKGKLKKSFLSS